MSADQRLRLKSDFDAVFREGVVSSSGPLVLRARAREDESGAVPCRFGYAISGRLGGAVRRNRLRRRLKESAQRLNASGTCSGLDCVVIARGGAMEAPFAELDATLERLVERSLRRLDRDRGTR